MATQLEGQQGGTLPPAVRRLMSRALPRHEQEPITVWDGATDVTLSESGSVPTAPVAGRAGLKNLMRFVAQAFQVSPRYFAITRRAITSPICSAAEPEAEAATDARDESKRYGQADPNDGSGSLALDASPNELARNERPDYP